MENLIDLKPLTKPAEMLIKKISNAAGVRYEPKRIQREAEAQAKADLIKANSEIEIADLRQRAEHRRMMEEMRHQQNMESITAKALPQLNDNADASRMDDDWLANFFDKCRIISDDEMQTLWSRILAGEANTPGAYSKRTVNCLSEMDKAEAEMFRNLCAFCWRFVDLTMDTPKFVSSLLEDRQLLPKQIYEGLPMGGPLKPLVFDLYDYEKESYNEIYHKQDIDFNVLYHLESTGLIKFSNQGSWKSKRSKNYGVLYFYHDKLLFLKNPNPSMDWLHEIGDVQFTQVGQQLATLCETEPVDGFYDYVKTQWREYSPLDIAIES